MENSKKTTNRTDAHRKADARYDKKRDTMLVAARIDNKDAERLLKVLRGDETKASFTKSLILEEIAKREVE